MLGDEQQVSPPSSDFYPCPGDGQCPGKVLPSSLAHSTGAKVLLGREECDKRGSRDGEERCDGRVGFWDGEMERELRVGNEIASCTQDRSYDSSCNEEM